MIEYGVAKVGASIKPEQFIMLRRPTVSGGGPSFFYLMLAQSCFRRARITPHPKGGGTLWQIGRNYLVSARRVTSMLESRSLRSRRTTTWLRPG
jgi:hypothetical protein